ncbi:hypothetical protein [Micropruina sp.]|uniref:hypothetical protein n=1 Tax=Micropruina sp. TaxID=2737536 RepID=UPI0039E690AF
MSGRGLISRAVAAAAAVLVLLFGLVLPTADSSAVPRPQATTSASTASVSPSASASPSGTPSDTDVDPSDDEPTDDGSDPTPSQNGTWIAIGGAVALALLAGLVVALRKR